MSTYNKILKCQLESRVRIKIKMAFRSHPIVFFRQKNVDSAFSNVSWFFVLRWTRLRREKTNKTHHWKKSALYLHVIPKSTWPLVSEWLICNIYPVEITIEELSYFIKTRWLNNIIHQHAREGKHFIIDEYLMEVATAWSQNIPEDL